jgi:TRAP-type C4-dicarboxylate transport system permease small subunit
MTAAGQNTATGSMVKLATFLAKIVYPLNRWLSYVSMAATVAMMLVITADVFMRRAFNSPIFGAYDVIKVLLVIIVFCAIAYVMQVNEHVIVDTLTRLYPRLLKRIVSAAVLFFNMIILALIFWQSLRYGVSMLQAGERLVLLKIPISPFIFVVAFGFAIFFLVVLVQFLFTISGFKGSDGKISSGEVTNG